MRENIQLCPTYCGQNKYIVRKRSNKAIKNDFCRKTTYIIYAISFFNYLLIYIYFPKKFYIQGKFPFQNTKTFPFLLLRNTCT